MQMKICRLCTQNKPLFRFSVRKKDSENYRNECKDCLNLARRKQPNYGKWHKAHKKELSIYNIQYSLKRNYGMTPKDYENMFLGQDGECAICGTTEFGGKNNKMHVDHCHVTGKVRALLCTQCNIGLGSFKDNPRLLSQAAEYVAEWQEKLCKFTA